MTSDKNRDLRPEGSALLSAALYGSWNSVMYLCQHAATAGHTVAVDAGQHPMILGIPLQRVEVI